MKDPKVFVIGVDGGTWDIIKPHADRGDLPTFKFLMENGTWGVMESTIPPVTVPAWPAFATGKNPGKFGVFDFIKNDGNNTRVVSLRDVKSLKIWDYLKHFNKKSIVVNFPASYPPERINGIMVSGMLTPDEANDFAYPPDIAEELKEMGYFIEVNAEIISKSDRKTLIRELITMIHKRKEIVLYLMKKYTWDFFFVLFRATDLVQHKLYKVRGEVIKIYKEIDKAIYDILNNIDNNTIVFIMSDHGFTSYEKIFHVNSWLEKEGLVKFRRRTSGLRNNTKISSKIGLTQEKIFNILEKLHLIKFVLKLARHIPHIVSGIPKNMYEIDWEHTKAYFWSQFFININLIGREKLEIVKLEEYEELREYIIHKLSALTDPTTGDKIIKKVFKKEEIYSGKYLHLAPDIVFITNEKYSVSGLVTNFVVRDNPFPFGHHALEGIFLAYGPGIMKGFRLQRCKIYDMAPTILHIFGLPIPKDMDGRVLAEIFDSNSEYAKREVIYVDKTYYTTKEEKDKLKSKIKDLKLK